MSVPDSVSADSPDLICVVCGDKANGMHYRALTCEGCKTFFRRNARHRDTLKCEMLNDGGCEMDMYTRRHCASCRMQKCISVGMQPDRLWDKNRLATRKPIKKKVKAKLEPKDPIPVPEDSESPKKDQDLLPELVRQHQEIGRLISMAYASAKDTLPQPPPNVIPKPKSPSALEPVDTSKKSEDCLQPSKDTEDCLQPSKGTVPHTSTSTSALPTCTPGPSCPKPSLSSNSPTSTTSPKGKVSLHQPSMSSSPRTSTLPSALPSISSEAVKVEDDLPLLPPAMVPVPAVKKCGCECSIHNKLSTDEQQGPVIDTPMIVKPPSDMMPKEVPQPQVQPSTSSSKDLEDENRSLLAGGMKGQVIIPQIMEIVVLLLRHMINFSKQLPGFQSLTSDDQATLIKGALVEYMILTSCPLYDIEKKTFNSDIWPTLSVDPDQVESAGFLTVMGSVMSFAVKMQKLSLNDEELALLFALSIISPDRRDLEDALKVEELQQPLVDALQTCVQINHPNKSGHFAKIIMLLTEVRNATEAYMDDLMSIQLSGNKLNPLLEELFSSDTA